MSKKFSSPRGTADILPEEIPLWHEIENKTRRLFAIYGYKEIRTPIFEETALFSRSLGETSDVVQKQMLNLEKEGLSLRPEGTASIVRSYIENELDKKEALSKFYYIGPMFRGERPQKGRLRQFHQIGIEAIGPGAFQQPLLDAEVIILAARLLHIFGLKDFRIKINTLGSKEDKESFSKFLRNNLQKNLSSLCEDCQSRFERNVFRILDCKKENCKETVNKLHFDNSYLSSSSQEYYATVKGCLKLVKLDFEESPKLVRGLDYYSHTVFEISHSGLGSQDAVGAGGRYNNLIGDLGGEKKIDVGAVGFSLGIERILLAIGNKENIEGSKPSVFIITLGPQKADEAAFVLLNGIREAGISAEMSYMRKSPDKQFSLAEKKGAKFAIVIGEDELKKNIVQLKDMQMRKQDPIPSDAIIQELKERLC